LTPEDFQNKDVPEEETKPFTSRVWLHMLRNRFILKINKIIREAALADEEAAGTFPAELKNYQGWKIRY
jgi:hypothetical protein